jgi:excisionase family DNA binding protein
MSTNNSETSGVTVKEGQLLTAAQIAQLMAVSERTVWRLVSSGKLMPPIKIGGVTRWRQSDILSWVAAGCP